MKVLCIKDREYDSALLIKTNKEKILNLNDCVIKTYDRAKEVFKITGSADILLTQFSYAAWKGGKSNKKWREEAAQEKLNTIKLQNEIFSPKYVIPFASFVFFSNKDNYYLNDCKNTTSRLIDYFSNTNLNILIMKPGDILGGTKENIDIQRANNFWMNLYKNLDNRNLNEFETICFDELYQNFELFRNRIIKKNNFYLMKLVRFISPIKVFQPIIIHLNDLDINVKFDYIKNYFKITDQNAFLKMSSESLAYIFKYSYGFDTLTVNGCFEESSRGGLSRSTKTLALDKFNNNGIYFSFKFLINFKLIFRSLFLLKMVNKKLYK